MTLSSGNSASSHTSQITIETPSNHCFCGIPPTQGLTAQLGASYSQAISASIQTVPVVGAAFSVGCMAMDASNISSTLQKLQKPLAKALALQEIEVSFSTHIPATIQYEVEALMRAIVDLRERHEEVQRNQENDLIEQELEELNFT